MTIESINALRSWQSRQGEPGDPPEFICGECGFEDCVYTDREAADE